MNETLTHYVKKSIQTLDECILKKEVSFNDTTVHLLRPHPQRSVDECMIEIEQQLVRVCLPLKTILRLCSVCSKN